jgi:hypothetical protein
LWFQGWAIFFLVGKLESFYQAEDRDAAVPRHSESAARSSLFIACPCENMIEITTDIRLRDAYDLQDGDEVEVHLV